MRKNLIVLIFSFLTFVSYSQNIPLHKILSENKIANYNNQKLILLDFWATWCAPCLPATQQLEIVQEYNKDKIFIISVTDEAETKTLNFLKKNPIKIAVAIDSKNDSYIAKYKITTRPYSVLLDNNGNYLWKGHPADLTKWVLNKYFEKTKDLAPVAFSNLIKLDIPVAKTENVINQLTIKETKEENQVFSIEEENVFFSGKMASLISELKNIAISDIEIDTDANKNIEIKCSLNDWNDKQKMIDLITTQFKLNIQNFQKEVNATEIVVENETMLWDKNQIVWEDNPTKYLIGNDRITANDVSISRLSQIVSEAKNKFYVYKGHNILLYDWDFQYLYDDLMMGELESSFGIKLNDIVTVKDFIKISRE